MRKLQLVAWVSGIVVMFLSLYQMSMKVQYLQGEIGRIERQIKEEQEAIHVLNAEWTYLTRPSRLKTLAIQHSELRATRSTQIVTLADIPYPGDAPHYAEHDSAPAGGVIGAPAARPVVWQNPDAVQPAGQHLPKEPASADGNVPNDSVWQAVGASD